MAFHSSEIATFRWALWEPGVKEFKRQFVRVVADTLLTYEALHTYMYIIQIEVVLNSRPLTPLSYDTEDLSSLTPAHFLIGSSLIDVPETDRDQLFSHAFPSSNTCKSLKKAFMFYIISVLSSFVTKFLLT